ncbi:YccS/YhfK family putative transporter [Enterobacillus tribolii]|uniref:YccS/YhfK family integral membrane protein n=1 Tax=Enterobacillus tribolii TaxID=1487935 RepID=A0A370QTR4_9GAMM|nr:YccS/YhfK family putative transporter [Enterobacillus tribolii]MBW7981307.1 hypothetical protein [Enterobacillus tribolii]RDK92632.1 YccS/YhfK family integral membrane protein [Enterobacillus tribolii]
MWRRLIYHPEVNYALRQTLVLCIPVCFGLLIGDLQLGLMFSLVPACCNIAGLDTPHKRFTKRLVVGSILFALSSFLVQQLLLWQIPLPFIMLGLALLFGVNGEISPLHARLLPAALIAAIFSLSMAGLRPIEYAPLLFLIGTAWYGAFTWFWFKLWKGQPIRESLSLLYRQLGDYMDAKYTLLTQHIDPDTALPPLLERQQKVMDMISQLYQQMHMLSLLHNEEYKLLLRLFQVALDLQEHITVSLHQPEEVQKLVQQSHAEAIVRRNAQSMAQHLYTIADNILYHRNTPPFSMDAELSALEKLAAQHPDNPVGHFFLYHFTRIAQLLTRRVPLYQRNLMYTQNRLPFWPALAAYLSFKSIALRNAARLGLTLAAGSGIGLLFHLPKPYWILMTAMLVFQNGYNATRVRIQHRALGTFAGLILAAGMLNLHLPLNITLGCMLVITLASYLVVRKNYGLSVIGFTITAVFTLQLMAINGMDLLLPRLIDTLIGCILAFAATIWLWPQWQSGLLRKNAHQTLESYQDAMRLLLSVNPDQTALAYARMKVNQMHNALLSSLNQAMQEPGFDSRYLADMRLWITHSQFIVEHLNAMTILARDHYMLTENLARDYLQSCEIGLQMCQQRLEHDGPGNNESGFFQVPELLPGMPITQMEGHLRRILTHLRAMLTISSIAWKQRPHHGLWVKRRLRD